MYFIFANGQKLVKNTAAAATTAANKNKNLLPYQNISFEFEIMMMMIIFFYLLPDLDERCFCTLFEHFMFHSYLHSHTWNIYRHANP